MNIILDSLCGTQHLTPPPPQNDKPIHERYCLSYHDPIDLLPLPTSKERTNVGRYGDGYVYLVKETHPNDDTAQPLTQLLFFSLNTSTLYLTYSYASIRTQLTDFEGDTPFVVGFDVQTPEGWESLHCQGEVWTDKDIDLFYTRSYRLSVSLTPLNDPIANM